jgi:hypothetical protein
MRRDRSYYLVGERAPADAALSADAPTPSDVTLGVIETSINIDDERAYRHVTPRSVLCWVRSMAANQLPSHPVPSISSRPIPSHPHLISSHPISGAFDGGQPARS